MVLISPSKYGIPHILRENAQDAAGRLKPKALGCALTVTVEKLEPLGLLGRRILNEQPHVSGVRIQ
jgi:hypothetical protein